ncbi:MAG: pantetheine-phosphate adenylyltransferase [Candidatus Sumerlaeia bacterium]|nr:pantetheine-phosphate adenylyltransferase [Candidatus Sumerlaeia bacterium]
MPHTPKTALYPGSFDILTNGHLDLIQRSSRMFDRVLVAVAVNSSKSPTFTIEERLEVLRKATASLPNVECATFQGLTVAFAKEAGARFIVRGLRAVSDFDFELQLAIMNQQLERGVETIFLSASPEYIFLSSNTIREVWRLGGDVSPFVPPAVLEALAAKQRP